MITESREAAVREVLREVEGRPGVVGAYLFGSGVRPYADAHSDVDLGIVVEGEHLGAFAGQIQELRTKLNRTEVDLSYWPAALLTSPHQDSDRRRLAVCKVVLDPTGAIAAAKAQLEVVPDDVRQARLRVHYFDAVRIAHLVFKADGRGDRGLAMMLTCAFVDEVAKLLFIERRQWPSPLSWMRQELALLDVSVNASLWALLDTPKAGAVRLFRHRLDRYLTERGATFLTDPVELMRWYFSSDEGIRARNQWCSPTRTG
jgi:predicted nucleotidyltransferase